MVAAVKNSLEQDGLGDLVLEVGVQDAGAPPKSRKLLRRPRFVKKGIYLPQVMVEDGAEVREIDYETDILSRIDWRGFDPRPACPWTPSSPRTSSSALRSPTTMALSPANPSPAR